MEHYVSHLAESYLSQNEGKRIPWLDGGTDQGGEDGGSANPVANVWRSLGNHVNALLSANAYAATKPATPGIKPVGQVAEASGANPGQQAASRGFSMGKDQFLQNVATVNKAIAEGQTPGQAFQSISANWRAPEFQKAWRDNLNTFYFKNEQGNWQGNLKKDHYDARLADASLSQALTAEGQTMADVSGINSRIADPSQKLPTTPGEWSTYLTNWRHDPQNQLYTDSSASIPKTTKMQELESSQWMKGWANNPYKGYSEYWARYFGVPEDLMRNELFKESGNNRLTNTGTENVGLGQMGTRLNTLTTAIGLRRPGMTNADVRNLMEDPNLATMATAMGLRNLITKNGGNVAAALAEYRMGPQHENSIGTNYAKDAMPGMVTDAQRLTPTAEEQLGIWRDVQDADNSQAGYGKEDPGYDR